MNRKIHIIPIAFGLSWIAILWLWLLGVIPVDLKSIIVFLAFMICSIITEAVAESNDAKSPTPIINTGLTEVEMRCLIQDELRRSLRMDK